LDWKLCFNSRKESYNGKKIKCNFSLNKISLGSPRQKNEFVIFNKNFAWSLKAKK
jgi:hypothetical protein